MLCYVRIVNNDTMAMGHWMDHWMGHWPVFSLCLLRLQQNQPVKIELKKMYLD